MEGRFAFAVELRLEPDTSAVRLEPTVVETRCLLAAPEPGEDGWLFFRDTLWRGEIGDEDHVRSLLADHIGLPVESASFRGFHVDEAYREALETEIAEDLAAFRADSVTEVIHKYLGSTLEVE